jgi:hypothetical protein
MIQLVWLTLLAAHIGAAGVWWWLMPGGFLGPLFIVVLLLTALVARGRLGRALLPAVLAAIPVFWMAFGISSRIVFFASFQSLWNLPFIGGAVLAGLWVQQFRLRLTAKWLVPLFVVPAALAGWALPGSQQAPDPTTAPNGAAIVAAPAGSGERKVIRLTKDAQIRPGDGRVVIRRDAVILNVQPMLSFADRSPDRCWTALAPDDEHKPTTRTLSSTSHEGARWSLYYKDEDVSVLELAAHDGAIEIDARSSLPKPIFSHVNSFAELTLQGHKKLSVSFSPAPGKRIEVGPPTAPARFAYVDESGTFHVMQASQQRRGPFTELAAGPLARRDPLVLTIYDGDKALFTVTLQDWAAEASTQLSPTAGWGVPVNAIELVRGGEAESSAALISLSLASTSIGRGTQTVGHTAGVYRNRITVRLP